MRIFINSLIVLCVFSIFTIQVFSQKVITVMPKEFDGVLTNPGIGFMTFQRFNGDKLNEGMKWTEGFPIEYQKFDGNLENKNYPMTSLAYFRIYWKYIEPEMGKYNWELIDKALKTAHERHQTLLLRVAPYGSGTESDDDVPAWYRTMVGSKNEWLPEGGGLPIDKGGWRVDAEDPQYAFYFGRLIAELGKRYDGHPDLEAVDLSILGYWGEGRGSDIISEGKRIALVNAYTDNFKKTLLISQLTDKKTNEYTLTQTNAGWRVDCIGDLGFWAKAEPGWAHMYSEYPQGIINYGMKDAWKTAPVSLEICGTFKSWEGKPDTSCARCQGYNIDDLDYIIDETLKWHISSFNAKSSSVPKEWQPQIERWLKKMGYRFVLRSFSYPESVAPNGKLFFKSWWDNKGVAPCYKKFPLAIRLTNEKGSHLMVTDADITTWLPGDNVYNNAVFVPMDIIQGTYELQIGIVDRQSFEPKVNLAIEGKSPAGWYSIGKVEIK